jgi:hypothetical protein
MDDFDELWEENRVLGPIYYIAWTIIGAFIFLSLFIVVLLEEAGDISSQFNMQAILKTVAVSCVCVYMCACACANVVCVCARTHGVCACGGLSSCICARKYARVSVCE